MSDGKDRWWRKGKKVASDQPEYEKIRPSAAYLSPEEESPFVDQASIPAPPPGVIIPPPPPVADLIEEAQRAEESVGADVPAESTPELADLEYEVVVDLVAAEAVGINPAESELELAHAPGENKLHVELAIDSAELMSKDHSHTEPGPAPVLQAAGGVVMPDTQSEAVGENLAERTFIRRNRMSEAEGEIASVGEVPDDIEIIPDPPRRVIAITNQKGGVGKTTTTVNLGAALAEEGHRVLIVDLDPQGNATTGVGVDGRVLERSIYDVLLGGTPIEDAIEPTAVKNLFICPATIDLAGADIELVSAMSRETKLRKAIASADDSYEYVLIDCPPSLGLLTINALAAATELLVPIQCEYYALEGLSQLIRSVELVQKDLNQDLELSTIVMTMYDPRTKLADQVVAEVRDAFGDKVCRTVIPRTVKLSEAPGFGQPITSYDPNGRGAIAYREIAKEVVAHAPRRTR